MWISLSLKNTTYFSTSLSSTTTLSIIPVTLLVPLEDLPPLQVYRRRKKIATNPDILHSHQSITITEVSELSIALQKGTHSCIQHPIAKVLSLSHLSPTYFSFATTLSFLSLKILSWCYVEFWMEKCYRWRDECFAC